MHHRSGETFTDLMKLSPHPGEQFIDLVKLSPLGW
jgi:hypothetical protein